ncbi:SAM-dependent methyltransferase [Agrilactobacillus composti DSM 18527 = JCM 14202]|uniref:SAM-dependent methyltransferase n=1 Tax=Agrilactobacillus composti DSM 18527 = JCM 14202 TaxID=1423734 RepID=X0PTT4_9LACO|nr:hypothetical protein [Agrilactobacillus composti]KRM33430.1 SAM-dependent methyltransferase [Agrilactobacillus composti DSM 18527 = JCM 14202]GAF40766.1 hypothetical protein JCM14202_2672 [Agrilactobacillus composti DSM 18527 = JCM 14202]
MTTDIFASGYLQQLKKFRQLFQTIPAIQQQIDVIFGVCLNLSQRQLPNQSLPFLGLSQSTYLEALVALGQNLTWQQRAYDQQVQQVRQLDHLLRNFRDFIENQFGIWSLQTQSLLRRWVQLFPGLSYLEVMAGNALFSYGMTQLQQKVVTTDDLSWGKTSPTGRQPWVPVQSLDAVEAVKTYGPKVDALVMIWSQDKNPIDVAVLQAFKQYMAHKSFFVLGEYLGATNSLEFWRTAPFVNDKAIVRLNQIYPRFDLIQDKIFLIR